MKTQEAVKLQRTEHTKGIIAGMSLIALWVALVAK